MSSLAPTKRDRPLNTLPSRSGLVGWLTPMLSSTVGRKIVVAVTGTALTGFVIAHMAGNLHIFQGRDALNSYAHMLKELGPILWAMRLGLLACLILHMYCSITLKMQSVAARPIRYVYENTAQATLASRTMVRTGVVIFVFIVFHLAHYTFGWIDRMPDGRNYLEVHDSLTGWQDVYAMTVHGFRNSLVSILYLIAQAILWVHMSHGVASVFQTLGISTPRTWPFFRLLGLTIASIVVLGNIVIVVAVWFNLLPAEAAAG
jgi:succinate dehydrogenase / fumarate reductase, cytochrome b subunit